MGGKAVLGATYPSQHREIDTKQEHKNDKQEKEPQTKADLFAKAAKADNG